MNATIQTMQLKFLKTEPVVTRAAGTYADDAEVMAIGERIIDEHIAAFLELAK